MSLPPSRNAKKPASDMRSRKTRTKRPPKLDEGPVKRAALAYLERYAASSEMLTRVLMRRIERAERRGAKVDREAAEETVRQVVERFREAGLIDDKAFAEAKADSLRRRGESARAIRLKLGQKGLGRDLVDEALESADRDAGADAEREAAFAYARRRRIGPYRPAAARADNRDRDLAALARRGFGYDIAKTVIDGDDELV
ncbi:MAG: recombination regulator RecX [Alphaproteobacteria bacterium]|nr:recombination regulator RecX [Alphaproteobacteria bacterium]